MEPLGLREIAVDWTLTNIGLGPRGSETADRRSVLKLEDNHRGTFRVCPRSSPQG
jgi:hypothetical protein